MPEGVQFTKPASKRIADTVRSVEGRPFPNNKLQRRRSGVGSRSTLWEVTAVQTGPETVTIKRVKNQDGDLIDASEKTDILYDPDNEPAVGDRGLLIRLGNGNLFFFRRGDGIEILKANKYCYVDELNPTVNFGSLTQAQVRYDTSLPGRELWGVMKFESVGSGSYEDLIIRNQSGFILYSGIATFAGYQTMVMEIHKVTDDFDPSTLTWNDAQSLTTVKLGDYTFPTRIDTRFITVDAGKQYTIQIDQEADFVANSTLLGADPDLDGAYGIILKGNVTSSVLLRMRLQLTFGIAQKTYAVKSLI